MKLKTLIERIKAAKPDSLSAAELTAFVNEVEGFIHTEIHQLSLSDYKELDYVSDSDVELSVAPPHDKLYFWYLWAMIDLAHGEYNNYSNAIAKYNNDLAEYSRYFARVVRPANGRAEEMGYYLSAYAIAVKHGFSGSEGEWVAMLSSEVEQARVYSQLASESADAAGAAAALAEEKKAAAKEQASEAEGFAVSAKGSAERAAVSESNAMAASETAESSAGSAGAAANEAGEAARAALDAAESSRWIKEAAALSAEIATRAAEDAVACTTAIKGRSVGRVVRLDDVSPSEHELGIKVSGEGVTSPTKVTRYGKNLIDPELYYSNSNSDYTKLDGDVFETSFTSGTLFLNDKSFSNKNAETKLVPGVYTLSVIPVDGPMSFGLWCYPLGSTDSFYNVYIKSIDGVWTCKITADTDFVLCLGGVSGHYGTYKYKLMLEAGSEATEYEKFVKPITCNVSEDGMVRGITSVSPVTTLFTDTDECTLEVEYARDVDKAFNELLDYAEIVARTAADKYLVDLTFTNSDSNTLVSNMIKFNDPMSTNIRDLNGDFSLVIDMYDENKSYRGSSDPCSDVRDCTFIDDAVYLAVRIVDDAYSGSITPADIAGFKYWDNVYTSNEAVALNAASEAKGSAEAAKDSAEAAEVSAEAAKVSAEAAAEIWRKVTDCELPYNNEGSKLESNTVQGAITELADVFYGTIETVKITDWANITSFQAAQKAVRAGIARFIYEIGDQVMFERTVDGQTVALIWDIIGFDVDKPADVAENYVDGTLLTHSMTLQLSEAFSSEDFAKHEALVYAGEAIRAGTYYLYTTGSYGLASGYHTFTTTKNIPAGGRIGFSGLANSSVSLTTLDENDNLLEIIDATTSATRPSSASDIFSLDGVEVNNELYVARGRIDYVDSPIRKYLQGKKWVRTNKFEIKPSWADNENWFANGFDEDFLSVLGLVEKKTYHAPQNKVISHNDLFFLLSQSEVYGGGNVVNGREYTEGLAYSYYSHSPYVSSETTGTDLNRKKMYISGLEQESRLRPWWLRSVTRSQFNGVKIVSYDGNIMSGGAVNKDYLVCPACCII